MSIDLKQRNHYIPKTYLEKFLNENNQIFVYKKGRQFFDNMEDKNGRLLTVNGKEGIDNIGVKNNLYIPEGKFEADRNIFENFFSEKFEGPYNDFVNFVQSNFFDVNKILNHYHGYIINLIASMMVRTMHYKEEVENQFKVMFQQTQKLNFPISAYRENLKSFIKREFPEMDDTEVSKGINDYMEMIKEGKFEVKFPRNLFIKIMMSSMVSHAKLISDMTIQILRNDTKSFFLTSDNPAVYFVPAGKENFFYRTKSLGGPYTELYFPLTRNLCLVLSRMDMDVCSGLPITHEKKKIVRDINEAIAINSRNFIYSPYPASFLDKYIEKHQPSPFRFELH